MEKYSHSKIEKKWPFGGARAIGSETTQARRGKQGYNPKVIEPYWQSIWEQSRLYELSPNTAKRPFYNLMMFPYPSAEGLHVGNVYAFCGSDIFGRFMRMRGFDVFEPIGLDGFGIHSENYALKIGEHPMEVAKRTEVNFYRQLHEIGNGFSWTRKLETYSPDYYKWTQWIFVKLFKAGLAYRAKALVNWCPSCLTVLADEQVVSRRSGGQAVRRSGKEKPDNQTPRQPVDLTFVCERCASEVEKRQLSQWFFRTTAYAQRLLDNLEKLDWSEKVKIAQRNWIGKSQGVEIVFPFDIEKNGLIRVFTTRPDTIFGATFLVLAPGHPQVTKIIDKTKGSLRQQIQKYVDYSLKKLEKERFGKFLKQKETVKTGIFTGFYATNPFSKKKIPIYIADYAVMEYGTGAIMGVPAHDQRDLDFARKYKIDILEVIRSSGNQVIRRSGKRIPDDPIGISREAFTGYGKLINSGPYTGLSSEKAIQIISKHIKNNQLGADVTLWHLRDWIISRQRYWGPPIPMIYCQKCAKNSKSWYTSEEAKKYQVSSIKYQDTDAMRGWYPVPESDLPVKLPYITEFRPTGKGVSPLASDPDFVKVKCPECGSQARRETDVSDTFLDSAWYFLRYPSVNEENSNLPALPAGRQTLDSKQKTNSEISNSKKGLGFSASNLEFPWNPEITRKWLPVDMYIGGAEHSVLHLLYSRFLTMALCDLKLIDFPAKGTPYGEPFAKFRAHGLLIAQGAKMSKSKGNIVNPDDYIAKYGADVLRCYLMFCGRFTQGGDFRDTGIEGMSRFLKRIWRLVAEATQNFSAHPRNDTEIPHDSAYFMHKTIQKVTEDIESLDYNTAIAAIMEWVNALEERVVGGYKGVAGSQSKKKLRTTNHQPPTREEVETLLFLLAPFAPYMTEELWSRLSGHQVIRQSGKYKPENPITRKPDNHKWSVHTQPWPKYDPKLAKPSRITLVVQVNGKVRERLVVAAGVSQNEAQRLALASPKVAKYLSKGKFKKAIFVPGRLINLVV